MSFDDHYVKNTFVLDLGDSGVRCGWVSLVVIGFGWLRLLLVLLCCWLAAGHPRFSLMIIM